MATVTVSDFLELYPEFSSTPAALIQVWLGVAVNFVDARRWSDAYTLGICLFTAHELALKQQDMQVASAGGVPGTSVGVISSKSVGPLSKSYDTSSTKYDDGGFWNYTKYGQQYWYFVNLFGSGGTQL